MEIHHDLTIPADGLGIDIGSSLAKISHARAGRVTSVFMPTGDEDRIADMIDGAQDSVLAFTGAGAARWHERYSARAPLTVGEFEAFAAGARELMTGEDVPLDYPVLVVSVGTGTSALLVDADSVTRIGGTALGGGSLMGLGELLCGTADFVTLADLSAQGDRGNVDLLVQHIYPEGLDGVPAGLTAANFGRISSRSEADLAQGICGLLGENLGLLCGQLARLSNAQSVVYCGTTVAGNPVLNAILLGTTAFAGAPARVLESGAFCGSLGALLIGACLDGSDA